MSHANLLFVIPARLASTRLPRKMLLPLDVTSGKSVLQMTYDSVLKSKFASSKNTIIATCDAEIKIVADSFGAKVCMTSATCRSGSDRVEEVLSILGKSKSYDMVVNVQGDEPFIEADHIETTVKGLLDNPWADVGTCAVTLPGLPPSDPSKVKVVCADNGQALYFSRQPIPHGASQWNKHLGIYAFRPDVLHKFTRLPLSVLEASESLEQLRLLENGYKIYVGKVQKDGFGGIDTEDDYKRAKAYLAQKLQQESCKS